VHLGKDNRSFQRNIFGGHIKLVATAGLC